MAIQIRITVNMAIFGKSIVDDLPKIVPAGTSNTVKFNRTIYAVQSYSPHRHTYQRFCLLFEMIKITV